MRTTPSTYTPEPLGCFKDEFTCDDGLCVQLIFRCDGFKDCFDNSDEIGCVTDKIREQATPPSTTRPVSIKQSTTVPPKAEPYFGGCIENEHACGDGLCVRMTQRCDGITDCTDYSDEMDCTTISTVKPSTTTTRVTTTRPTTATKTTHGTTIRIRQRIRARMTTASLTARTTPTNRATRLTMAPKTASRTVYKQRTKSSADKLTPPISIRVSRPTVTRPTTTRPTTTRATTRKPTTTTRSTTTTETTRTKAKTRATYTVKRTTPMSAREAMERKVEVPRTCFKDEYTCADGLCVFMWQRCDGINDCPDESDEMHCDKEAKTTVQIETRRIIDRGGLTKDLKTKPQMTTAMPSQKPSQQVPHACLKDEHTCGDGLCVFMWQRCDGINDCADESDEMHCDIEKTTVQMETKRIIDRGGLTKDTRTTPLQMTTTIANQKPSQQVPFLTSCLRDEFKCGDGLCVFMTQRCDGFKDCLDNSDEIGCSNDDSLTTVRKPSARMPETAERTNQKDIVRIYPNHSVDQKERKVPSLDSCSPGEHTCGDGLCLHVSRKCDGFADCPDNSDENDCNTTTASMTTRPTRRRPPRKPRLFGRRRNRVKVARTTTAAASTPQKIDRHTTKSGVCADGDHSCGDGLCVFMSAVCDGVQDCPDNSDETNCDKAKTTARTTPSVPLTTRSRPSVLMTTRLLQTTVTQTGWQRATENRGDGFCANGEHACGDGLCVFMSQVCDGFQDCPDNSDETKCNKAKTAARTTPSVPLTARPRPSGPMTTRPLPSVPTTTRLLQTTVTQTGWQRATENRGDGFCANGEHACGDGLCVFMSQVCDGFQDCPDNSDEANCIKATTTPSAPRTVRRTTPRMTTKPPIQRTIMQTGWQRAQQDQGDGACADAEHTCGDGLCVFMSQVCDGFQDCPDNSDETDCDKAMSSTTPMPRTTAATTTSTQRLRTTRSTRAPAQTRRVNRLTKRPKKAKGRCHKDDFTCGNGMCIFKTQVCDGVTDCQDYSDENGCNQGGCRGDSFTCGNGMCILMSQVCDGIVDCQDGIDEKSCNEDTTMSTTTTTKRTTTHSTRAPKTSRAPTQETIHIFVHQSCLEDEHTCSDGLCVFKEQLCDGISDCLDNSDEMNCNEVPESGKLSARRPPRRPASAMRAKETRRTKKKPKQAKQRTRASFIGACLEDEHACGDGLCVFVSQVCDGYNDCLDNSDEADCNKDQSTVSSTARTTRRPTVRTVRRPTFLERKMAHANKNVKDKKVKGCLLGEFRCKDGQCIKMRFRCDGTRDCLDNSDELKCHAAENNRRNNRLALSKAAAKIPEAVEEEIEKSMDGRLSSSSACDEGDFTCGNGECVVMKLLCDGVKDCTDNSDETNCGLGKDGTGTHHGAESRKFSALRRAKLQRKKLNELPTAVNEILRAKLIQSPRQQTTERQVKIASPVVCLADEFTCGDGVCLLASLRCDGVPDCLDKSDEVECDPGSQDVESMQKKPVSFAVNEAMKKSLRLQYLERQLKVPFLHACQKNEHICGDGKCVDTSLRCDGFTDCKDHSDEMDCDNRANTATPVGKQTSRTQLPEKANVLPKGRRLRAPIWRTCADDEFTCRDGMCIYLSQKCDGVTDCLDNSDEAQCTEATPSTDLHLRHWRALFKKTRNARSSSGVSHRRTRRGDRRRSKSARPPLGGTAKKHKSRTAVKSISQEVLRRRNRLGSAVRCHANWHRCGNGDCVRDEAMCDGHLDCPDHSDETNCHDRDGSPVGVNNNEATPIGCPEDWHSCGDGRCVPLQAVCNGRIDCHGASDESNCNDPGSENTTVTLV